MGSKEKTLILLTVILLFLVFSLGYVMGYKKYLNCERTIKQENKTCLLRENQQNVIYELEKEKKEKIKDLIIY